MSTLSLCLPFYTNSEMLAHQYSVWAGYDAHLKAQIEIVLVDDGSPEAAVDVPRPVGLPPLRIFRVLEDRPWHQHGARNLAAHVAEGPWLFLTDMDHVLPNNSLSALLARLDGDQVFTFHRLDAPHLTPKLKDGRPHPHPNTFALTKARYWQVGGYDERLCGFYGTDGYFRQRLFAAGPATHLPDVPILRVPREVIFDANTRAEGVDPKAFREAGRRRAEKAAVLATIEPGEPVPVLQFQWERVL